jgi:hypothetical protein
MQLPECGLMIALYQKTMALNLRQHQDAKVSGDKNHTCF